MMLNSKIDDMSVSDISKPSTKSLNESISGMKWFVIYTRARAEKKVAAELEKAGIEVLCPLIHTMRQWSDRKKKVSLPMFPSYVFVNLIESEREKVLAIPYVLNFVFWLGKPAVVRQKEIDAIKDICQFGSEIFVENYVPSVGEKMEIKEGLFKGLTGMVDRKEKNRLILFVKELNMKISFEMRN